MLKTDRQQFSIKCECTIVKNSMILNSKKKSKFSQISLNPATKMLSVIPFNATKNDVSIEFSLNNMKTIHKKYIEQGKITLQFFQKRERISCNVIDQSVEGDHGICTQVLIDNASKENLQLLIKKIVDLKKSESKPQQSIDKPKTVNNLNESEKIAKKKLPKNEEIQPEEGINNRQALKMLYLNPIKSKPLPPPIQKKKYTFDILSLPPLILDTIFSFCKFSLHHRSINKRFSEYILRNITSIKLKDEIDTVAFNKLCKWAINVECRMKNVKNLDLCDRYDERDLIRNKAKTLKFGNWKEMTSVNIQQLKGLRIFCLEIPYFIKFDLENLYGLRMVELRLKSSNLVNFRNDFVREEAILKILTNVKELKVLELPFSNTSLISKVPFPQKIQELRIFTLNQNTSQAQNWLDFTKFTNLKTLALWYLEKGGVKKQNFPANELTLPQKLQNLQIGSFYSVQSLQKLPFSIKTLKLIGDNFYDNIISNITLPQLKYLDLTLCKNARKDSLENVYNLNVLTCWSRQNVGYATTYYAGRNINIATIK